MTFEGFLIGQETHANTDGCPGQYIGRIVDSQINPWQANQKNRVHQGNPSENTGNEKKTGGKRKEHNRMIAREGTPIVPVYWRCREMESICRIGYRPDSEWKCQDD